MNAFGIVSLLAFLVYVYLGVFVLQLNPKFRLNQLFFLMAMSFAWWALSYVFLHWAPDEPWYWTWIRVGSPSWVVCPTIVLHFFMVLTRAGRLKRFPWVPYAIYLPAAVFLYAAATGHLLTASLERGALGWVEIPDFRSAWFWSFTAYYVLYPAAALALCWLWGRRATGPWEKRQAPIIVASGAITLLAVLLVEMVLPVVLQLPVISPVLILIWVTGIGWAMLRQKFMLLTPALAAEDMLRTMSDPVLLVDEQGRTLRVNRATTELTGYREEDLVGEPMKQLLVDESNAAPVLACLMQHEPVRNKEMELRTSTGGSIPVMVSLSAIRDRDGTPFGAVAVCHDMTARKRAEEQRRSLEAQMLRAQKLESLGVMAGGIAHDFNNLLQVVMTNAELALAATAKGSPARGDIDQLIQAARRASGLCGQMLAYSGRAAGAWRALDLGEEARNVSDVLRETLSKNHSVEFDIAPGLPAIQADARQVGQVLANLILNASEALDARPGVITISVSAREFDRDALARTWVDDGLPAGNYVILEVRDTGCGMDRDTLPKVFDPFFSTKFTGRGLGLGAVLGIVRSHKGAISVESKLGVGTTFRLLFPASNARAS